MAQVTFESGNYAGELAFTIETKFDGSYERNIMFSTFDEMNHYLERYYSKKYDDLFNDEDVYHVQFTGVSFRGKQDTEHFAVNMTDGWKRATMIFDESKFGDINVEKLKRIKVILSE